MQKFLPRIEWNAASTQTILSNDSSGNADSVAFIRKKLHPGALTLHLSNCERQQFLHQVLTPLSGSFGGVVPVAIVMKVTPPIALAGARTEHHVIVVVIYSRNQ